MDESRFSAWKYRHPGAGSRSRARKLWAAALLLASVLALAAWPLAIFLFVACLLVLLTPSRRILVGPRYLICGADIVYFANVERVDRDDTAGTLRLTGADGRSFVLERERFPSNARKADKIRRNQAAKFAKVADRVLAQVRSASPAAEIAEHC